MISFSVIIPAFNAGKTIELAIRSCFFQTYPPLEIIIVDDGSTDDTVEKVKLLNNDLIKLITLPRNCGVSNARNTAWDLAVGNYIAFLDSDDQWHPKKLGLIATHLQKNDTIDLIFHQYTVKDFDTNSMENTDLVPFSFSDFLISNPAQTSCVCLKTTLSFRFDKSMSYCEDHDLLLQIAHQHTCFELPLKLTKLGRPQLSKGGLSGNLWKMRKGEMKAYAHLYRLNKGFALLIPFLFLFSLMKYFRKIVS